MDGSIRHTDAVHRPRPTNQGPTRILRQAGLTINTHPTTADFQQHQRHFSSSQWSSGQFWEAPPNPSVSACQLWEASILPYELFQQILDWPIVNLFDEQLLILVSSWERQLGLLVQLEADIDPLHPGQEPSIFHNLRHLMQMLCEILLNSRINHQAEEEHAQAIFGSSGETTFTCTTQARRLVVHLFSLKFGATLASMLHPGLETELATEGINNIYVVDFEVPELIYYAGYEGRHHAARAWSLNCIYHHIGQLPRYYQQRLLNQRPQTLHPDTPDTDNYHHHTELRGSYSGNVNSANSATNYTPESIISSPGVELVISPLLLPSSLLQTTHSDGSPGHSVALESPQDQLQSNHWRDYPVVTDSSLEVPDDTSSSDLVTHPVSTSMVESARIASSPQTRVPNSHLQDWQEALKEQSDDYHSELTAGLDRAIRIHNYARIVGAPEPSFTEPQNVPTPSIVDTSDLLTWHCQLAGWDDQLKQLRDETLRLNAEVDQELGIIHDWETELQSRGPQQDLQSNSEISASGSAPANDEVRDASYVHDDPWLGSSCQPNEQHATIPLASRDMRGAEQPSPSSTEAEDETLTEDDDFDADNDADLGLIRYARTMVYTTLEDIHDIISRILDESDSDNGDEEPQEEGELASEVVVAEDAEADQSCRHAWDHMEDGTLINVEDVPPPYEHCPSYQSATEEPPSYASTTVEHLNSS